MILKIERIILSLCLIMTTAIPAGVWANEPFSKAGHYQGQAAIDFLRSRQASTVLSLAAQKRQQELETQLLRDSDLWVDSDAHAYYGCSGIVPPHDHPQEAPALEAPLVPLADTFKLHSLPGADHTIYIDFDGHSYSGSSWNDGVPFVTPAYDFDGNTAAFSDAELERIQHIWKRVAEDYLPFHVNVTTEEPPAADLIKTGGSDTKWGIRVVTGGGGSWFGGGGGVAYVFSFNWNRDEPVWVFEDNLGNGAEKYTAEAISHEAGHALGLYHDGTSGVEYYQGHGSGNTGWSVIMGNGYYRSVTHWSKGEYTDANNTQDDIDTIVTFNGFTYRTDDHGNTLGAASALPVVSNSVSAEGIIERSSDVDVHKLVIAGSTLDLDIDPGPNSPNLDVYVQLTDASGNLIADSNPTGELYGRINETVAAGTYYLKIEGTGLAANGSHQGYSDYSSLGAYSISGTVTTTGSSNQAPVATAQSLTTPPGESMTITLSGTDPESSPLNYEIMSSPSNGTLTEISSPQYTYTPNSGYTGTDSFSFRVNDGDLNSSYATISISMSGSSNQPPVAVAQSLEMLEGRILFITLQGTDSDGDSLTYRIETDPSNGVVTGAAPQVVYRPTRKFTGSDEFTFTVHDGTQRSSAKTISVAVREDVAGTTLPKFVNKIDRTHNQSFTIPYRTPSMSSAQIRIFNQRGLVHTFSAASSSTGLNYVSWDGTLAGGKKAPTGRYRIQIKNGTITQEHDVLIIR